MHRTQILLDEWQFDALQAQARGSGRSLSDLVREIVASHLGVGARRTADRLLEVEGVAEGPADLGRAHDDHLYGAAAASVANPSVVKPPAVKQTGRRA